MPLSLMYDNLDASQQALLGTALQPALDQPTDSGVVQAAYRQIRRPGISPLAPPAVGGHAHNFTPSFGEARVQSQLEEQQNQEAQKRQQIPWSTPGTWTPYSGSGPKIQQVNYSPEDEKSLHEETGHTNVINMLNELTGGTARAEVVGRPQHEYSISTTQDGRTTQQYFNPNGSPQGMAGGMLGGLSEQSANLLKHYASQPGVTAKDMMNAHLHLAQLEKTKTRAEPSWNVQNEEPLNRRKELTDALRFGQKRLDDPIKQWGPGEKELQQAQMTAYQQEIQGIDTQLHPPHAPHAPQATAAPGTIQPTHPAMAAPTAPGSAPVQSIPQGNGTVPPDNIIAQIMAAAGNDVRKAEQMAQAAGWRLQ